MRHSVFIVLLFAMLVQSFQTKGQVRIIEDEAEIEQEVDINDVLLDFDGDSFEEHTPFKKTALEKGEIIEQITIPFSRDDVDGQMLRKVMSEDGTAYIESVAITETQIEIVVAWFALGNGITIDKASICKCNPNNQPQIGEVCNGAKGLTSASWIENLSNDDVYLTNKAKTVEEGYFNHISFIFLNEALKPSRYLNLSVEINGITHEWWGVEYTQHEYKKWLVEYLNNISNRSSNNPSQEQELVWEDEPITELRNTSKNNINFERVRSNLPKPEILVKNPPSNDWDERPVKKLYKLGRRVESNYMVIESIEVYRESYAVNIEWKPNDDFVEFEDASIAPFDYNSWKQGWGMESPWFGRAVAHEVLLNGERIKLKTRYKVDSGEYQHVRLVFKRGGFQLTGPLVLSVSFNGKDAVWPGINLQQDDNRPIEPTNNEFEYENPNNLIKRFIRPPNANFVVKETEIDKLEENLHQFGLSIDAIEVFPKSVVFRMLYNPEIQPTLKISSANMCIYQYPYGSCVGHDHNPVGFTFKDDKTGTKMSLNSAYDLSNRNVYRFSLTFDTESLIAGPLRLKVNFNDHEVMWYGIQFRQDVDENQQYLNASSSMNSNLRELKEAVDQIPEDSYVYKKLTEKYIWGCSYCRRIEISHERL